MRRIFLVLLIALLPMRALAGGVMSLAMALDPGSQNESAVIDSAPMPVDCPMLAQGSGAATDDDGGPAAPACCDACTLCFAFTPLPANVQLVADATPVQRLQAGESAFVSSVAAPALKPPIS